MKKLKSIELQNYRSHERSLVDFGMLTSFVGDNDSGKSNVWKAIDLILSDSPFSEAHLRYGTKEGHATLTFDDDTWIKKWRKGSQHGMVIFDGKEETPYSTVKDMGGVIEALTGFKPIVIDKNAKAESVQLLPIDAGQSFLITGVSYDGVLRRVNRLLAGSGIETAKVALTKERKDLQATLNGYESQIAKQTSVMEALEHPVWDEIRELFVIGSGLYDNAAETVDKLNALDAAKGVVGKYLLVKEAADFVTDVEDVQLDLAKKALGAYETASVFFDRIVKARLDIETAFDNLDNLHETETKLEADVEALRAELVAAQEDERNVLEAQTAKTTKTCPTCKRPL